MRRPSSSLFLCWALLLAPSFARAADPASVERAAALVQEGVQKRSEGKDEAALALFYQADALDSTPKTRAQMALAEQSLGLWVLAERHLREALGHGDDPWIEKNKALLDSSATRIAGELGWLVVLDVPPGAQLVVDGELAGTAPLATPIRAVAGSRLVEVKAKGYDTYVRRITVRSGETTRERAVFVLTGDEDDPPKPRPRDAAPRFIEVPVPSPWRTVGWITFGTGAAAALFGGASFIVRQNYVDDYNSDGACPGVLSRQQPGACAARQQGVSRWSVIGTSSLVAGGVLAVGGLALVFFAPASKAKVKVGSITWGCGARGPSVACAGSF